MDRFELQVMKLITFASESKSCSFEALKLARQGEIDKAKEKLEESRLISHDAHKIQTELIVKETSGDKVSISLLLIHAQDHLMNSICTRELIEEMIITYEEIKEIKGKLQ
jgi:PTS system cellobiose-specific IIA component